MFLQTILTNAMLSSNTLARTVGRVVYNNADKILLGAGIGFIVGGTVSAALETTQLSDIFEDHKRCLAEAKEKTENRGKEIAIVYRDTAIDLLKAYGPCVLLTGLGIGCILGSHYILTSRYTALTAAYAVLDKSFDDYRGRVRDAVGAEKEYDIYNDVNEIEVTELNEKGKTKTHKEKLYNGSNSPYSWIFDESNPNWQKDPSLNEMFLEQRQEWFNRRLDKNGIVTLAEVLFELDLVQSKEDLPTWAFNMVWTKSNPDGDGYIDFGHRASMEFMSHREPSVWLNFNCDGILSKLRKEKNPMLAIQNGAA